MTQPTIKEKMEKLLTDEILNPEPCNIRLFATNITRLICEEMTVEKRVCGSEFPGCSIKNPCDGHEGYNCAAKVTEEKAQEILKTLE